jgi:signal transduction histidine kinase
VSDADRLNAIVDRLLNAGSTGASPESVDAVVDQLRPAWERHARAENVQVDIRTTGDGRIDPYLLRAVVEPIVENAIAHAVIASVVQVNLHVGDDLAVTVDNTGPGVPPEVVPHLFEPWASGTPGGSGLGLWLARETAREAGGDVRCDRPGPGLTRFTASLPVLTATADPAVSAI